MAAAVLHYAAENKLCQWLRIKMFTEPEPETRAVSTDQAAFLMASLKAGERDRDGSSLEMRRLYLLWEFRQGTRISQTLSLTWDNHIALREQTFRLYNKKAERWETFPLHPEVFEALSGIPEEDRRGRLFPWSQKTGVYRWLRPLVSELGIHFTPHMARHSVGTWLNAQGAGLRTIMAALGHKDPKSSLRYQHADIQIVKTALGNLPSIGKHPCGETVGNDVETRRKPKV
jgi:integrase